MNLRSDKRQKIQMELDFSPKPAGEAREARREGTESRPTTNEPESPTSTNRLMEEVCERENLMEALRRVKANKGSAGVDGMTVGELTGYLKQHWPTIREQLLSGTYEPKPVRRVEIPKPDGGWIRKLGIPSVLDRFIQQAVMQGSAGDRRPYADQVRIWKTIPCISFRSAKSQMLHLPYRVDNPGFGFKPEITAI